MILKKVFRALKHITDAYHWFCCLILPAAFILPLLTIVGELFGIDLITNSIEIYLAVKDALAAGTQVSQEDLTTAANVVLWAGFFSYIPTLLLMKKRNDEPGGYRKIEINKLFKCLCLGMFLNTMVQFTSAFVKTLPMLSQYAEALKASNTISTSGNPLFTVLLVGIVGPMVEEITLRRGVQKNLYNISPTFGVIATSVLFGVLHGNLIHNVSATAMGLGLGYMYCKTDNLWYPTALHMAVNLNSVLNVIFGLNGVFTTILLPFVFGVLYLITKKKTTPEMIDETQKEITESKQPIKVKVKKIKTKG